ncbi:Low-density lipoprotein receptor-related protein 1,Very low-density lipoprotein receptor,Prolow-density lipoprotein receptor-related protein 1 [Mytilus coruscus]|uniref:Low-density lipoprotein receptor-related protein 1,Very low-density lipoprotein receptor,Prolow-density lipoprotein receptor-related protein 1 n=1 Tax=Mytilus coruscus TaxID=42192 RepID=A0A6J8E5G2_MYTCO|nr:Low-density lipoprotein receptor-related protein 1,Very low-density lipoprotein receptor,Prolow-density lipoprotein receptor-related protein 1 [Mytilus coruscus]
MINKDFMHFKIFCILNAVCSIAYSCGDRQYECNDGSCIPSYWYCGGNIDCDDGEDEDDCSVCPSSQFRCSDGFCIKDSSECDNTDDCYYGEDELYCTEEECPQNEFRCNDGSCILHYFLCDDFDDCENGEDEEDCNEECPYNKYECSDGYCISTSWLCDDYEDCENGEDEEECTEACDIFQYECNDGSCIPETWYCDQDNDCGDGGDEADCSGRHMICFSELKNNLTIPGAGTTYISKEEMTTKHTSTNIYDVSTVKISKAPVSSTIDRMTTKMVDIITTGYDRKTTRITDSLRTTSFDEKSTTNVITGNLSVIKQTTVYDGASSFQENEQAQDGQMGNKKKIIYGIIAGSTIAVVIGVGVMIGAGIFLKYRHHKQRV